MADEEFDSEAGLAAAVQAALDMEAGPEETSEAAQPEIQPQPAAEAQPVTDGVNDDEVAEAPVVESPAPVAAEAPKVNPEPAPKAEQRVAAEPSANTEADAAINQSLQRINSVVQQLETAASGKFADLKTEADVFALMQTDPQRYNEFVIAQTQYQRAKAAQVQVQQEAQRAYLSNEQKRLMKEIPDLADPDKGEALKAELRAYAKSQGIPDNRQARSADEVIRLHKEMTLAKKLAGYEAKEAAAAKALEDANKKAAKAPPVQQPGVQRDVNKNEKLETDFERFSKSGESEDLARYLQHII